MIFTAIIMLFIIIIFFMCNYRNSFTKIISLYFVTIALMTIIGIIYVSRFSDYYSLIKLDYRIYLFLSSVKIPLSNIARLYNFSIVLYMFDSIIFMHCLHKLNWKKFIVLIIPLIFFCIYNDPAVSKYLFLEAMTAPKNSYIFTFMKISSYINRLFLYAYMVLPFVSLFFYCKQTSIFVKRKDAIVSCCCILAINIFVFFVFINGIYHIIMFDNVNIARLPNKYTITNSLWLPVPLLTIMIFVITLTLLFRPFQVFNKLTGKSTGKRITHFNKNVSAVFHIYKNAFLGISQQFGLAESHIKSGRYNEALANIEAGKEITTSHMAMLTKILDSLSNIKTNFKVMNLLECVRLAIKKIGNVSSIDISFNTNCEYIEIIGDKHHLTEVFYNILLNAVEALSKKNNGNPKIKVDIILENELVLVSVFDNGTGIPKKDISKIFNPFFSTKSTGSGVGLNYVNNMIKIHHGEIKVDSSFGNYTLIQIVLPVYVKSRWRKWIR